MYIIWSKPYKTVIYIKLTSFDAEICAEHEKSHIFNIKWVVPIGIAHFLITNRCLHIRWITVKMFLSIPLDTYIPSEQVAIEVNIGSEDMEILKEHLCHQRGIKRIKLPMKSNETESSYLQRIKAAFQSVHIFITSDTEEDVRTIRKVFENWRNSQ